MSTLPKTINGKIKLSIQRYFINFWPLVWIFIFIRIWIVPIHIFSIEKNVNLIYPLLGIIGLVILFRNLRFRRQLHANKQYLLPILLLIIANLISTIFSTKKLLSILFLAQLGIAYLLGFLTTLWIQKLKAIMRKESQLVNKVIIRFYKILVALNVYNLILSLVQMLTIYQIGANYLKLPIIIKKIIFNGYFINQLPTQRWNFSTLWIRPPGLLGDTNVNAMFTLISLLIFIITEILLKCSDKDKRYMVELKKLLTIGIITTSIIYMLSLSRSALLGFIIIILSIIITFGQYSKEMIKQSLLLLVKISFIIIILGAISTLFTPTRHLLYYQVRYIQTIVNINKDHSAYLHKIYSKFAITLAKRNKYKPWGIGTFPIISKQLRHIKGNHGLSPHSLYATVLMEQGAIGLTLYILALILIWRNYLITNKKITSKKQLNLLYILQLTLNLAVPFLSIATIFYYGFWDISTWLWGIHKINHK